MRVIRLYDSLSGETFEPGYIPTDPGKIGPDMAVVKLTPQEESTLKMLYTLFLKEGPSSETATSSRGIASNSVR